MGKVISISKHFPKQEEPSPFLQKWEEKNKKRCQRAIKKYEEDQRKLKTNKS